jgi:hypothetical protein
MTAPAPARRPSPVGWVGRNLAGERDARPARARGGYGWLVATAVLLGLGAAALRSEIIHLRYELSAAMQQERALTQERREWTARVRALRDPSRLAKLARERGFARPARVVEAPAAAGAPR